MTSLVHHFGLTVGDLDRSVPWYCRHLGFREIYRGALEGEAISEQTGLPEAKLQVALLAGGNIVLELLQYLEPHSDRTVSGPGDIGAAHVCVVVEDVARTLETMRQAGVELHASPAQLAPPTTMAYVRDPDGIMVEIMAPGPDLRIESLLALSALDTPDDSA